MTTPRQIITFALKEIGAIGQGQVPSAEDYSDGFKRLNMMIAQWNRWRYMIYHLVDLSFVGDGSQTKTIGPSGDINTTRPAKIEAAFYRMPSGGANPTDFPLTVLNSREDYDRIGTKLQGGPPMCVFLDTGWPLATLYTWPIPDDQYTVFLSVMNQLTAFVNPSDDINLPPEYEEALMYNLATRMSPSYGIPVSNDTRGMAKAALNTIKMINAQIPLLAMPPGLNRMGRYDIYGDSMQS